MTNELEGLRARVRELERLLELRAATAQDVGARSVAALAELAIALLSAAAMPALLDEAVTLVARVLGTDCSGVFEFLPDGRLLLRAGSGWKPGSVGRTIDVARRGASGLVRDAPVVLEDLSPDSWSIDAVFREHELLGGVGVTVSGRERLFGALTAHTRTRRVFSAGEIDFLKTAAGVLAAAMERRRAEDAQRRSEQKVRALLEAAAEGIVIVDGAGRIQLANARTEALFGYDRDELLGHTLEILLPERFRILHADHRAGYFAAPRARSMGHGLELSARRKDGTEFPVEISLSFVETEGGMTAMAFVTDVSARRQLERSARQTEKLAALGSLAAGLAHELNNPIGVISSRAELILLDAESRSLPPDLRSDLQVLHRHAQRVARIAGGLLSFARHSAGERRAVDVNALVEETLLLVEKQIVKEGVRLIRRLSPEVPPVWGDPGALQQVIMNLLTNAREAVNDGGEISIETSSKGETSGGARLVVRDTGPGISPDILPRVFDPFFTTKSTGTGLGLSISYGIVRDHEGTMEVQSEPGQGAAFTVTLPSRGAERAG